MAFGWGGGFAQIVFRKRAAHDAPGNVGAERDARSHCPRCFDHYEYRALKSTPLFLLPCSFATSIPFFVKTARKHDKFVLKC